MKKLLRLKEDIELTGTSPISIYRLISEGQFVKPIHTETPKMTAWVSSDIEDWIEE